MQPRDETIAPVAGAPDGGAPPFLSICTATFDRAALLPRVFESLRRQEGGVPFEWVVVDDGSGDETPALVGAWVRSAPFPVRYLRQRNAGKHVALNAAFAAARGTLAATVDSDDWLRPDAVYAVHALWTAIAPNRRAAFCGVGAVCARPDGTLVGDPFPREPTDARPLELFHEQRLVGDKWFAVRTELLRETPFPVYDGERFVSEGIVWDRLGARYLMRCTNRPLQVVEYQPAGLSSRSVQLRMANPLGAVAYYRQLASLGLGFAARTRAWANFLRFRLHARVAGRATPAAPIADAARWAALPIGILAFVRDRWVTRAARAGSRGS